MDPVDEREILKSVRAAKQLSDFVIVTIHAHEPGNWSQEPDLRQNSVRLSAR